MLDQEVSKPGDGKLEGGEKADQQVAAKVEGGASEEKKEAAPVT